MKKKFFLTLLLWVSFTSASVEIVKFKTNAFQSRSKVYISSQPKEAKHWIYRVKSPADMIKGGNGIFSPIQKYLMQ